MAIRKRAGVWYVDFRYQDPLTGKTKRFKANVASNEWHDLEVKITGETMQVSIDGKKIGSFESAGIAHSTKSRLRLAVGKQAWIDDVKVWGR